MSKKTFKLVDVEIEEGSFVPAGDNKGAHILFFKQKKTKTEEGKEYPASDYAYVPDPDRPSEWKLRLTSEPGSTPDPQIVGAAIAALGPGGFRGNRVQIPGEDRDAVIARVRRAWLDANPEKGESDLPVVIKKEDSMSDLEKKLQELEKKFEAQSIALTKANVIASLLKATSAEDLTPIEDAISKISDEAITEELTEELELRKIEIEKGVSDSEVATFRASLPDAVGKVFDGLEKSDKDSFMKSYKKSESDPISKVVNDLTKANEDQARRIEKMERKESISKLLSGEFADLKDFSKAEEIAEAAVELKKTHPDQAAVLVSQLKSLAAQLKENDLLTKVIGKDGSETLSATEKAQKLAKEYAKENQCTFEKAYAAVLDMDSALYEAIEKERGR